MSLLQNITTGRENKAPRVLIYGFGGIGKSSWSAGAPNPIFIQTEDGLSGIDCCKFPLAKDFDEVKAELNTLLAEEHSFRTVVIDSVDWLERLIFDDVCKEFGVRNIERADGGYGKGYVHGTDRWREVLGILDELRNQKGMIVIFIAHAKVERFEDPENIAYDRYVPRLHKFAAAVLTEWVDNVFFATTKFRVQRESSGFAGERGIASPIGADGGERIIRTVGSPACVAKNRVGLPAEIPLSWPAFMGAYQACTATNNQTKLIQ
jgi:hypothetical protein